MESHPAFGSEDSGHLDVLATLVEAFEQKNAPIGPPEPLEAIRFRMEEGGLTPRDLAPLYWKHQEGL